MKKPNHFDAVHTTSYEKYVEEVVLRGLGDVACGLDPLSMALRAEAKAKHPKNDSGFELVRSWNVLNKTLEEHEALFAGTRIELPSISEFEDQGVVDFELLRERYERFLRVGMQPQILIAPSFYGDEEYYENLCADNELRIWGSEDHLKRIARLDENMFSQRDFLTLDTGNPRYCGPASWTVSIADIDPNNKRVSTIDDGFGKKMFYYEYIVMQLLLKRRSDTMLDMNTSSADAAFNIIQDDGKYFYTAGVNLSGNILSIIKFEDKSNISYGSRKIVRNVATASAIGLLS